jgi:hypothetical protein
MAEEFQSNLSFFGDAWVARMILRCHRRVNNIGICCVEKNTYQTNRRAATRKAASEETAFVV